MTRGQTRSLLDEREVEDSEQFNWNKNEIIELKNMLLILNFEQPAPFRKLQGLEIFCLC